MRTEKQIQASRINGAKSRGPITDSGKRHSSQNSLRHGLYSQTAPPEPAPGEAKTEAALRADLEARFGPDPLIEAVITAHREFRRLVNLESTTLRNETARQRLIHPDKSTRDLDYIAFQRLAEETGTLLLIDRLESRSTRRFQRALGSLIRRAKSKNEETNPGITAPEHQNNAGTNPGHPPAMRARS